MRRRETLASPSFPQTREARLPSSSTRQRALALAGTGAAALVRIFSRAVSLVAVASVTAIAMRPLFLSVSEWLWHFARNLATLAPLLQANSGDPVPNVDCGEISGVAKDGRVFFFSKNDYWYYERCSYVPLGYTQPVHLALLKKPLISDVKRWLASGYKIIVLRAGGDWVASSFAEFVPDLPQLDTTETASFEIYGARR